MSSASLGRTVRYLEVEVAGLGADAHLAGDEGEAVAHFQKEALEPGDDGGLDFGLGSGRIFRQAEEFQDVRVLDEVADGGTGNGGFRSAFGCLGGEQALVAAGFDLALELADAPVLRFCLLQVVETSARVLLSHNQTIMAPGQKATQCVAFFPVREREVEFPEILEVGQ